MPLTREFKEAVQARLRSDRKYRKELLREGVECLLAGDVDTGKSVLRDYINATIGFEELSRRTKRPAKSLMRMLSPRGNPQARNLFEVIQHLQRAEGLQFELSLRAAGQRTSHLLLDQTDYGGIATTDIQEGLRRLGKRFGQLEPGGTTTPLSLGRPMSSR